MQVVFAFVLVLGLLSPDLGSSTADANPNSFDVSNYGAVGDGSRDDSDVHLLSLSIFVRILLFLLK